MRAVAALAVVAGCEPTRGASLASSGDSGAPPTLVETFAATQVGSEGFWECPTIGTEGISDPLAPLPSFEKSAADLTSSHVGDFPLRIVDLETKAEVAGSLALVDAQSYVLVQVAEVTGCVDYLQAQVTGTLVHGASAPQGVAGVIAVRPDGARLLVSDQGDLGTAAATWGAPSLAGVVGFRVEGDLGVAALDARAAYVDCGPDVPDCANADVVARVTATR